MDAVARAQTLPERPSGRLRRAAPDRAAGRHGADRGHGQLPGEPPHGQGAADALDPARGRSAAPGPLRPLQRHARHRFRAEIPADQRPTPANGGGRLTPNFATVPLETVSRELGITAATLTGWRGSFLAAGEAALTTRAATGEELESERLKRGWG